MVGREVRLDIDEGVSPDIIAPMTDLGDIGPFDIVYTAHALEHLYPHEVNLCLAEIKRVLKKGGVAIVVVPDLDGIKPTGEVVYDSPAGQITGLDMYYGKSDLIEQNPYMAHKTGFTTDTLKSTMERAGFEVRECVSSNFNALVVAIA